MITSELLRHLTPLTPKAKRDRFIPFLNDALPRFGIDTELRVAAFLGTIAPESDWFKATAEYGRGAGRYYGKPDAVTGQVYFGRGLIQTTHKVNYADFTKFVKSKPEWYAEAPDFVKNPDLLEQPYWAVESACFYWQRHKLNVLADKGKFFAIQGLVNRGDATKKALGYEERLAAYEKALRYLPDDFTFPTASSPVQTATTTPPAIPTDSEQKPTTDQQADSTVAEPKPSESILDSANAKLTQAQDTLDKLSNVSKQSLVTTILTKGFGWLTMLAAVVLDNWEIAVAAAVIIVAAIIFFHYAKKRATQRAVALLGDK